MITENQFNEFLKKEIKPNLNEFDSLRKEINTIGIRNKIFFALPLGISLIFVYMELYGQIKSIEYTNKIFYIVAAIMGSIYFFGKPINFVARGRKLKVNSKFKSEIIYRTIQFIQPDLHYKPKFRTKKQQLETFNIVDKFTEYAEDDGIYGELNKRKIKISETHIYNNIRNKFDGLYVIIKLKNNIEEAIIENHKTKLIESTGCNIDLKVINDTLCLGIHHREKLFEFNFIKKNDEQIFKNLRLLYYTIYSLNDLSLQY